MAQTVASQKSLFARKLAQIKQVKSQKFSINVCHLYPDLMDTYGDKGNILTIIYRCQKRGIKVKVGGVSVSQNLKSNIYDLYFFGGGQDQAQTIVGDDLQKKSTALKKSIDSGSVLLSICGGYQLLQNYFQTKEGTKIKGIGLFDAYTEGSDTRFMNNLMIEINPNLKKSIEAAYPTSDIRHQTSYLIGFENHSGKTYLGKNLEPLGSVEIGNGNNGEDKTEGAIYKNAFGCYLHGSLLPKNPQFADYLISKTLERKYGPVKLEPLDDTIEWQAHESAIKRARSTS